MIIKTAHSLFICLLFFCGSSVLVLGQTQHVELERLIQEINKKGRVDSSLTPKLEQFLEQEQELKEVEKSRGYQKLGIVKNRQGNFKEAIQEFRKSIYYAPNSSHAAASHFSLHLMFHKQGNLTETEQELKKSIEVYDNLPDSYEKFYAYYLGGGYYSINYNQDEGLELLLKAYEGFHTMKEFKIQALVMKKLAFLHNEMKNPELSKRYYTQLIQYYTEEEDSINLSMIYNGLGNLYKGISITDSAIYYYNQSLIIKRRLQSDNNKSVTLNNLASVYSQEKKYKKAQELYEESIRLKKKKQFIIKYSVTYNELGLCALKTNRLDKAKNYLDSSELYLSVASNKTAVLRYYEVLSEYYVVNKEHRKAIESLGKHIEEYKKVYEKETTEKYQELQERYNAQLNEEKILHLELSEIKSQQLIEQQESEMRAKNNGIIILILLIILAIGLLMFIKQRYKNEQDKLRLSRMEEVFKGQEEIKEKISQNLHDLITTTYDGIRLKILALPGTKDPKTVSKEIITDIKEVNNEIRLISHRLSPLGDKLKENPLSEIIKSQLAEFQHFRKIFIDVQLPFPDEIDAMKEESQINLYSILIEAMSNVEKHSQATEVIISHKKEENKLILSIKDNGIGSNLEKNKGGIGLRNMKQRALLLKGELEFNTAAEGAEVKLEIPIITNTK